MDHTETLSAFVDGEAVDLAALAAALEDPDARGALVDFARMRQAARAGHQPLPPSLGRLRQPAAAGRILRWAAAAAVLLLVFVAGWLTPLPRPGSSRATDTPPQPSRIERFQPGVDWQPGN